jgi:hypothetical protein
MLLGNRPTAIEAPAPRDKTYAHIDDSAIAVIRWLNAARVDYVVVGSVARIIRADPTESQRGPVAIVPAPYGRNLDRLARALTSVRARARYDGELSGPGVDPTGGRSTPLRISADKLVRAERWTLRLGNFDLDVEGRPAGVPRYQELLYEAVRFELAEGVSAEIASPIDIAQYEHMRRTGLAPQISISRAVPLEHV